MGHAVGRQGLAEFVLKREPSRIVKFLRPPSLSHVFATPMRSYVVGRLNGAALLQRAEDQFYVKSAPGPISRRLFCGFAQISKGERARAAVLT